MNNSIVTDSTDSYTWRLFSSMLFFFFKEKQVKCLLGGERLRVDRHGQTWERERVAECALIFDHEFIFLGNFSKEILWTLGWFMFVSTRCLKTWKGPLYMTVLSLRFFRLQQLSVNLGAKPTWKLPTGHEIAELTWVLRNSSTQSKGSKNTIVFPLCGWFFSTWSFSWQCSPFWIFA